MKSKAGFKGRWLIKRINNKTKEVLSEELVDNVVVYTGLENIAKRIIGDAVNAFNYIAIGTSATGASQSQNELVAELQRVLADSTGGAYEADYKAIWTYTFSFGGAYSITEAGIFDSGTASGSIMMNRVAFTAKDVNAETDLYVKCTLLCQDV